MWKWQNEKYVRHFQCQVNSIQTFNETNSPYVFCFFKENVFAVELFLVPEIYEGLQQRFILSTNLYHLCVCDQTLKKQQGKYFCNGIVFRKRNLWWSAPRIWIICHTLPYLHHSYEIRSCIRAIRFFIRVDFLNLKFELKRAQIEAVRSLTLSWSVTKFGRLEELGWNRLWSQVTIILALFGPNFWFRALKFTVMLTSHQCADV